MAMNDRRGVLRRRAWLSLLTVWILAVAAFLGARSAHLRMDWTDDHRYTLSATTRAVLGRLDAPLMIRAYVSEGLPQPYGHVRRFIRDMLDAYHEAGGDKVSFRMVDPAQSPDARTTLMALNVPMVRVQVVEDDQARVKQGYLALVLDYLDKQEVIPVVQSEQGFEYLLTSKIRKLIGKERPTIGVVEGFGATPLADLHKFRQLVGEDYAPIAVDPSRAEIPDQVRVLIIAGVEREPDRAFRYRLEQFRLRGGGVWLLAGRAKAALDQGIRVRALEETAVKWAGEDFGVAIDGGLVMDRQATRILVDQQQQGFMLRTAVDYPFLLRVTDLDKRHPITRGLEGLSMPFASPVDWLEKPRGTVLARSSSMAAVQAGPPFDVDPLVSMKRRFAKATPRRSSLMLVYDGPLHAHLKAPKGIKAQGDKRDGRGRLLVSASPSLLEDAFMDGENLLFVLNALDWLSGNEELIALRSRGATQHPLTPLDAPMRALWKGMWMFLLPLFVVLFGLARWRWLRKQRSAAA